MANICKTVNLYTRKIKGGKMLSYFLDYYPGYRDEATNKVMRHESLGIYIYAHPKTQREKDYNARLTEKAEALRCRKIHISWLSSFFPFLIFHTLFVYSIGK